MAAVSSKTESEHTSPLASSDGGGVDAMFESVDAMFESVDAMLEFVDAMLGSVDAMLESVDGMFEFVDAMFESVDAMLGLSLVTWRMRPSVPGYTGL